MKKNMNMNQLKFSLNSQVFPLEAVCATGYSFIDRAYIYLDKKGDNILVSLKPKEGNKFNLKALEGEFRNELLHNTLRMKISQDNAKIREYIVSQAIYSSLPFKETKETGTTIQEEGQEEGYERGYLEDPLGIAIPWEEKMKMKRVKKKQSRKPAKRKK